MFKPVTATSIARQRRRTSPPSSFYLMSRGLSAERALGIVVNALVEPVTRLLPIEYAVEWSRLTELLEGSIG
ncbi:MAG: hypothetical protein R2706_02015 [Acidimicrobiales bacterium]